METESSAELESGSGELESQSGEYYQTTDAEEESGEIEDNTERGKDILDRFVMHKDTDERIEYFCELGSQPGLINLCYRDKRDSGSYLASQRGGGLILVENGNIVYRRRMYNSNSRFINAIVFAQGHYFMHIEGSGIYKKVIGKYLSDDKHDPDSDKLEDPVFWLRVELASIPSKSMKLAFRGKALAVNVQHNRIAIIEIEFDKKGNLKPPDKSKFYLTEKLHVSILDFVMIEKKKQSEVVVLADNRLLSYEKIESEGERESITSSEMNQPWSDKKLMPNGIPFYIPINEKIREKAFTVVVCNKGRFLALGCKVMNYTSKLMILERDHKREKVYMEDSNGDEMTKKIKKVIFKARQIFDLSSENLGLFHAMIFKGYIKKIDSESKHLILAIFTCNATTRILTYAYDVDLRRLVELDKLRSFALVMRPHHVGMMGKDLVTVGGAGTILKVQHNILEY